MKNKQIIASITISEIPHLWRRKTLAPSRRRSQRPLPATAAAGKDRGGGMPRVECTGGLHRGRESFVAAEDVIDGFLYMAVGAAP
jgi:hypothetical protein